MKGFGGFGEGTGSSFKKETNYLDDKTNPSNKTKSGPKGKIGSEYRKKEYDARGWKYDDTIAGYNRDGTKKASGDTKDKKNITEKNITNKENVTTKKDITTKKDTNKKDENQSGIIDKAATGHAIYEVGKYGKKFLKKPGSWVTRIASRIPTVAAAGGAGYLFGNIIKDEIEDPGINYKRQQEQQKKRAQSQLYTQTKPKSQGGGASSHVSFMGHGK